MDKELKKEIILENYDNPFHRSTTFDNKDFIKINSNSPSCIDNIDVYFKVENNIIKDVYFNGEACVISTSSTSMILKKIIGKNVNEVKNLLINYKNMISEKDYDKELLGELLCFDDIYLKPNRVGCALTVVRAIDKLLEDLKHVN